jgi:hypothetical protein
MSGAAATAAAAPGFVSETTRRAIDAQLFRLQEGLLAAGTDEALLEACLSWFTPKHLKVPCASTFWIMEAD